MSPVRKDGCLLPGELAEELAQGRPLTVLDVRTGFEFKKGHIPGAIHAPTWKLVLRLAELPADKERELIVHCELGPRAVMAKWLLALSGYRNLTLLAGHMAAWRRLALPMEKG